MINHRLREYSDKPDQHKVSDSWCISPPQAGYTQCALDLFQIDYTCVLKSNILNSVGNGGNLLYAARARMDNTGAVKSHSCIVNYHRQLDRIAQRMEAEAYVGDIEERQRVEKEQSVSVVLDNTIPKFRDAGAMFRDGVYGPTFTKAHS